MVNTIADQKSDGKVLKRKRTAFSLLSILFGVILGLWAVEISLRFLDLGYRNRPLEPDPVLHHVHPKSYSFRSHFGGHEVFYDQNGLVSDPEREAGKEADCRIAFLGDSFTESRQVPYKDSFVGLLEAETDCVVRNYGVASYSPILYYLQWKHLVNEWNPDIVFVQLYSNDSRADDNYFGQAQFDADGRPDAIPGPAKGWFSEQLRKSYLLRFLRKVQLTIKWNLAHWNETKEVVGDFVEENPQISDVSSDMLLSINQEVVDSGAKLALFAVPSNFRLQNPDLIHSELEFADKWKAWVAGKEIVYIDLVRPFGEATSRGQNLFFERDVHFNEEGHAVVASTIQREYPSVFKTNSF